MSIKKLLRKVAVGAAVGALVIAVAVMVTTPKGTVAQPHPQLNVENNARDVKAGTAELPILFNIDLRAVLYAYPNLDGGFTPGLDTLPKERLAGGSIIGNVGWLFVETNYSAWDVLVRRDNGGYLVREPKAGEKADIIGGIAKPDSNCVPGPFSSEICSTFTTPEGGKLGIPLRYVKNDHNFGNCSLELAVGAIKVGALTQKSQIMANIKKAENVGFGAKLNFGTSTYASFANSIYDSIISGWSTGVANNAISAAADYFGYNLTDNPGDATNFQYGDGWVFPQIKSNVTLELDNEIGDPYNPKPKELDQSIVFFINARLDIDKEAGERLSGNRNGVYTENLIFTFYGLY